MTKSYFIVFIWFFSMGAFSQNQIYKFKHLSTNEGLSQNGVIFIMQDKLEQIWIGTRDGLNKYDGVEFTKYRHHKEDPNSISNSDISCIEQDNEGYIWVGTASGLNRYNPLTDTFKSYLSNNSALLNNNIRTINIVHKNKLLIGTSFGISIYDRNINSYKTILKKESIIAVSRTRKGIFFIATKNALFKLVSKTPEEYHLYKVKGTESLSIQDILETPNGNLLLGSRNNSVLEYNCSTGKIKPYFEESTSKNLNKNVRQLLYDAKGNLWIGTYNGLLLVDKNKKIKTFYSDINDNESISDNFIKALFKDKKGSIWVGTYQGGINIWDESNVNFINITQKPGKLGLGFKAVSAIVNHNNLLFFGTEGGGITILNTKTRTYEYLNTTNTPALKTDNIKSLYLAKDNNLWIGTFEHAFTVYNLDSKSFNTVLLSDKLLSYLKGISVYTFAQEANGNMLIGTMEKGLIRYNLKDKSFKAIDRITKPYSLSNENIRGLKVDSKKNIWISTLKGLNLIQPSGQITSYFYDKESTIGYSMTAVFEDSKKRLWVGTEGDGFFRYVNNKFEAVNLKIDNTNSVIGIRSIIEDNKGDFWISTVNQGIIHYNPNNNSIIENYTQKEGLVSDHYNNNSSLQLGKNNFFFGGPSGAVYFNTNKLVKNTYSPQVILIDLKVKNKSIAVNDESKVLSKTIAYTKEIDLSYEQGNFTISFAIPNFINSKRNTYVYRLKGLEKDWIKTDQNTVSYTIQNSGNYTFEVKGVNNDGVANVNPTTLNIRVYPAPWRTWWAFLLYGLLIFLILNYLLSILKSKSELRRQLDLEKLEAEQAKEVSKAKLELFTNISHEFRTPLTLILAPLQQILENYKGSGLMYKKLKVIEGNANHLLQLINRLMDFRKLENNTIKLEAAEGNIVKFLQEIYLSFTEYAKDGNYDYSFNSSNDEILVYYDRYKLERVFYNLISNAFRYTPKNGTIAINIIQGEGEIIIQVKDTGVGIAQEYRDKIFERFFEVAINNKPDNDYNKGTGIGLFIVKNIVDLHKGQIAVQSNTDQAGSIFSVTLFLGRAHLQDSDIMQDFKFSEDLSQYVNQLDQKPEILMDDFPNNVLSKEKLTILLVEDNKQLRKFMRDILIENYNILEAENGKIGYKIAKQKQVDLIVSDVVMPIMNGTELCSLIKEDIKTSHIPLILLTSRSSLIYKLEGLESGANDYISKPFNVIEFQLRIKNLLTSINRFKQKMSSSETLQSDDVILSTLDEELYSKALQIIEKNISNEQFDIPLFCEELGIGRSVLFLKVKAWTNFTPNEFIQHIRLNKATQLLEQGKMTISEISYKIGFSDPKYFSKCFSKKFGRTPSEYAKTFTE